jgi:hypothetical protein
MKKLLLIIFTIISIKAFGQTPSMEMLIFPKYIEGSNGINRNGIPYVYRAKISGLHPGRTYRYQNRITASNTGSAAGSYLYILPSQNVLGGGSDFYRPAIGSNDLNGSATDLSLDYGVFTADSNGQYTGWFIQESVRKITGGATYFLNLKLNDPGVADGKTEAELSKIAYQLFSPADQPLVVLTMALTDNASGAPKNGTAIWSTAATSATDKNFVFLYDNENGTGRPVAGTLIENDGVLGTKGTVSGATGYSAFYWNNVNGVSQTWGTMIPNTDAKGVRRIEQWSSANNGTMVGYNTSADGTWPSGRTPGTNETTVNVKLGFNTAGTAGVVIDGSKVTLAPVKTAQTVAFTNTFPASYKVGDPDFTLSASSSAGLTGFQYTVAPAGVLEITGNTVKIIGGGTATITVTEPGNANYNAASATQSITVDASPQAITGLAASYAATYGDANLELTATGGASGNPIIYSSDDPTIAEVVDGNKIKFNKSGTVNINANQSGNGSYSAAPTVTAALTIAKASLDVIAEDKLKTQGSANPVATFVYGAFKNTDDASSVSGTPVLTIAADATSAAGIYDITIDVTGLTSDKYTFNAVKGKLTVEAKLEQVITVTDFPASLKYGDQPAAFQISSNSPNVITFTSSRPDLAVVERNAIGQWSVKVLGAGEVDIKASQAEDAKYIAGDLTKHISIAKAELTVTADDKAKLTGEPNPQFTARYAGFVNNDDLSKLSGTLNFSLQTDATGTIIIPSGLSSVNYNITYVNGRLSEGNTAFANITKVYGDAAFDPAARSQGATVTYSVANTAIAQVNASGLLEIKGAGSTQVTANFSTGLSANATLTVAQKEVTVNPVAATKVYGQPNPVFTATYSGLAYAENETVFSNPAQFSTVADLNSPAGRYAITSSSAVAANYRFVYGTGVFEITKAALVVKADDLSKTYGQANPVLTLTATGLALQDKLQDLALNTVTATTATAASGVNTYPITVAGLANAKNYTITYQAGSLVVQPAALVIKAADAERPQGQPNPAFIFTYQGFVNGDTPAVFTTAPVASTTATVSSGKGIYPINVTGAAAANYAITYEAGQLFVKGLPIITFTDFPVITYGDANFTPVAVAESGAQPTFSSDNLSVATIENGRVKIVSAGRANIIASFPGTADYVANTASKPLVIVKRTLLVRADSKTKTYGQANPALTATYDGFAYNETASTAVSAPALLTTTATPLSPVGTYPITGTGGSALNYTFSYEAGILTINKAVLTATADNKSKVYGADNPTFTARYTGFVNAETEAVIENKAVATTLANATSPAGTYPIVLSGATDENYSFNYVNGILTVTATSRTITMDAIATKLVGDADFVPSTVLTSGETPVFSSSDASVATIVDNKIHIVGAGNVTITAAAPVNPSYSSTPSTTRLLVVSKVAQTITFEAIPVLKPDGTSYTLKATASSGLPVTFSTADPSHVSLTGDVIRGLRVGKVQVSAVQAGNNQYAAAKIAVQIAQVADAEGDGVKVHPALSINGDGVNEFLTIDGIKDYPLNKVTIISRSGIKVFDIEGYDNDTHVFTGKSKSGAILPQGTYFCLIEYNVEAKVKRKTGYFILKY